MAHLNSIGAAFFSDLSICAPATDFTTANLATLDSQAEFEGLFLAEIDTTGTKVGTFASKPGMTFVRVKNVRSFPAMGTPPNIVKVPNYGSATSSSIQGQADAPQLELDINYVADQWTSTGFLATAVGNGTQYVFRFTLLQSEPAGYGTGTAGSGLAALKTGGSANNKNTSYYWIGKVEALSVTPSLTDAATAKITMSIQSKFYGAYSFD